MRVVTAPVTSSTSAWRGRGDDAEAEALQVVVRARRRASARARSRCTSRRRRGGARGCGRGRRREARSRGGARRRSRRRSASAVGAGVAELEALVDQREVGQQVAGGGVRERRPVRVGAGAQAEALDAVAVALDDADRRPARALDAADADRRVGPPGSARPRRRAGRVEQLVEQLERLPQLERALLEPRLDVAGGRSGTTRLEAVVGRAAGSSLRASSASPAARAAGPTAPRRRRRLRRARRCRAAGPGTRR